MDEKAFVAHTQVVQPRFSVKRLEEAVLRTSPIAHGFNLAFPALAWQGLQFGFTECPLRWALEQLDQRRLLYVSKVVLSVHKMVT